MPTRVLVYKRTHHGDPDHYGQFGINDCMGESAREASTRSSELAVLAQSRERLE